MGGRGKKRGSKMKSQRFMTLHMKDNKYFFFFLNGGRRKEKEENLVSDALLIRTGIHYDIAEH